MKSTWFKRASVLTIVLVCAAISPAVYAQFGNIPSVFRGSPVQSIDVIDSYPHDPNAYTQGLVIHDGMLYEGTGHYGKSSLRIVDIESGEIKKQIDLSRAYFAEGVTIFNGKIYQLSWRKGVCHVYDLANFERVGEFSYQGEGWGITHNGEELIMSNGSAELNYIDAETFRITKTVPVWDEAGPVNGLNELEYIEGEIWANVFPTDLIARINPETGEINAWVYCKRLLDVENPDRRSEVLNGIAYDHDTHKLYLTGKYWPRLYEVEIIGDR